MSVTFKRKSETLVVYTSGVGVSQIHHSIETEKEKKAEETDQAEQAEDEKGAKGDDLTFRVTSLPSTVDRESITLVLISEDQFIMPAFTVKMTEVTKRGILDLLLNKKVTLKTKDREASGLLLSYDDGFILRNKEEKKVLLLDGYDVLETEDTFSMENKLPEIVGIIPSTEVSPKALVEMAYTFSGISWTAFYQLILTSSYELMVLKGKGVVRNYTGSAFKGVRLKLVTGDVQKSYSGGYQLKMARGAPRQALESMSYAAASIPVEAPEQESFGENYSFVYSERFDIADKESKEVQIHEIIEDSLLPVSKQNPRKDFGVYYEYVFPGAGYYSSSSETKRMVDYGIEFKAPAFLTEGNVSVFQEKDKDMLAIYHGKGRIPRTPKGVKVRIPLGRTMNTVVSYEVKVEEAKEVTKLPVVQTQQSIFQSTEIQSRQRVVKNKKVTGNITLLYTPSVEEKGAKGTKPSFPTVRLIIPMENTYKDLNFALVDPPEKVGGKKVSAEGKLRYDVGPLPPGVEIKAVFSFTLTNVPEY